jgi:hypothetical protein
MSADFKVAATDWFRAAPAAPGTLIRSLRFPDESVLTETLAPGYSSASVELAWRSVVDAFDVLAARRLVADQLIWTHEKTRLHCARRADGVILALLVPRQQPPAETKAAGNFIADFLTQAARQVRGVDRG